MISVNFSQCTPLGEWATALYLLVGAVATCLWFRTTVARPKPASSSTRQTRSRRGVSLCQVNSDKTEANTDVDIIAIHGLNTKSPDTWTWRASDHSKSVNWLADLLPKEVGAARIFTCDWPADLFQPSYLVQKTIDEYALLLLNGIQTELLGVNAAGGEGRPILFIASCLGGVILAKALVDNGEEYKSIRRATRGIIFLATPFRGTSFKDVAWAELGLKAWASVQSREVNELLGRVKGPTSELDALVRKFTALCLDVAHPYLVFNFYETEKTSLPLKIFPWLPVWLRQEKQLVDQSSATLDMVESPLPLSRSHVLMNKFDSPECEDYKAVANKIQEFLSKIRQGTLLAQYDLCKRAVHHSIAFEGMFQREDEISPSLNTLRWVADDAVGESDGGDEETVEIKKQAGDEETVEIKKQAREALATWLRSSSTSGIFHITGKLGAGKSTLMKHISTHPRVRDDLVAWAGDKSLVLARFFFWHDGTKLQKSLEGLHRSILFQALEQYPALIEEVFPTQWQAIRAKPKSHSLLRSTQFRSTDLEKGFKTLVEMEASEQYRLCLFIDGLDEYSGEGVTSVDHMKLARDIQAWSASGKVKFCVSSREQVEFTNTFRDSPRIKLHELNQSDIRDFCWQTIEQYDASLFDDDFDASGLVDWIVPRAEGVFLWAKITVQAALVFANQHDSFDTIKKKLMSPPGNLIQLYDRLLNSLPETERKAAYKFLAVAVRLPSRLSLLAYTWLDDLSNEDFPAWRTLEKFCSETIEKRRNRARYQIQGYTKGLLNIGRSLRLGVDGVVAGYVDEVTACHRSLEEYVREKEQMELKKIYPTLKEEEIIGRLKLAELAYICGVEGMQDYGQTTNSWATSFLGPLDTERVCTEKLSDNVLDGLHHFAGNIRFEKAWICHGIGPFHESVPPGFELVNPVPFLAAFHNQAGWIQKLTTSPDSKMDTKDTQDQTLLSAAVLGGARDTVRVLLDRDPEGSTLHVAIKSHALDPTRAGDITVCDILAYQVMAVAYNCWTVTASEIDRDAVCNILELFLEKNMETGYVFVLEGFDGAENKLNRVATLEQAVQKIQPTNIDSLNQYFSLSGGDPAAELTATRLELRELEGGLNGMNLAPVEGMVRDGAEIPHDFRAILC